MQVTGRKLYLRPICEPSSIGLNSIYLDGQKTEWKEIHPGYLSYLGEKSLSRHLAVDVALEKMDETRFIPFCVEEMDEILSIQTLNTTPVEKDAENQVQNEEEIYHDWVGYLKQKIEVGDPKGKTGSASRTADFKKRQRQIIFYFIDTFVRFFLFCG